MLGLFLLFGSQAFGAVEIGQRGGALLGLVVAALFIHGGKAGEFQNLVAGAEGMARAARVDLHGVIACIGHLAGDEAAPDQLVQPILLARQVCLNALGVEPDIAGANGLMRVLRAGLGLEVPRRAGVILGAVVPDDEVLRGGKRFLG